jgi:hypothetical protein
MRVLEDLLSFWRRGVLRRYHEWVLAEFTGSGSLGSIDYHASTEENEKLSVEEKCRGIGEVL